MTEVALPVSDGWVKMCKGTTVNLHAIQCKARCMHDTDQAWRLTCTSIAVGPHSDDRLASVIVFVNDFDRCTCICYSPMCMPNVGIARWHTLVAMSGNKTDQACEWQRH